MAKYEITAEMNLKNIIAESREVAQALNEFADNLERIEKKYAELQESEDKLDGNPVDIGKAVGHYEGTLEVLKGIDLEDNT